MSATLAINAPAPACCSRCDARVAEAGMRERRRLERNLHDGAQQRLVALSLQLRTLGARLAPGSEAERMLEAAEAELAASLGELRQLARGLDRALVGDRGLGGALRTLADRAPLPVDLRVELDGPVPAAVEVAAYFVVSEALTNVAKHAHAMAAWVSATLSEGTLVVQVVDDGIGGACTAGGSGLRGLAERAESVGGSLDVCSTAGGGTTLTAELPCTVWNPKGSRCCSRSTT